MLQWRRLAPCVSTFTRDKVPRYLSSSVSAKPPASPTDPSKTKNDGLEERIISALVVNRPGTLAQIADVFGYADQNITGLCVRSTVVPELSRVTISCFLRDRELPALKRRLRALVAVTFFHLTTVNFCVANEQLLLRSQLLLQIRRDPRRQRQLLRVLHEFDAELIVPHDEQDADNDPLVAMDYEDYDDDGIPFSYSSAASATQFLTLADEPDKVVKFMAALTEEGFQILETQTCGPVFLDTSHSTLDPESAYSFRREVASEVANLLVVPTDNEATTADPSKTDSEIHGGRDHVSEHTASVLRQLNKNAVPTVMSSDTDPLDADVMTPLPPTSTFQLHTNDQGYFSPKRLRLHARIAQQLYSSAPQDLTMPKFVLLLGIPGSGKSTMLSHLDLMGQLTLQDFVNFDVDDVIALLPEFYHAMLNVGLGNEPESRSVTDPEAAEVSSKPHAKLLPGPQTRYQLCRDEARFILKKNLHSAIMSRKNIILHGSGKSFTSYARTVDQVKAAGFDTHVICLDIPITEAYTRVHKRSSGYGRDVPRSVIDEASSLITRNFRRLATRVPNAHLFDSTEIPPRLVWSKQRSEIVTEHPDDNVQRKYGIE
ncbi:Acetolactate synthase, small subunit [Phytophthora megakarya]|uniref:Acetolactate synthase, small subunit n=1 Tax=Phytophthora megakarya TaxID=4795 RepID=A0A225X5V9_9STRA|nr:Acetolactate synthase, small subunit [Phytophthora megakarya]